MSATPLTEFVRDQKHRLKEVEKEVHKTWVEYRRVMGELLAIAPESPGVTEMLQFPNVSSEIEKAVAERSEAYAYTYAIDELKSLQDFCRLRTNYMKNELAKC